MRLIDADALIQKRDHAKNYSPDMYVIGQGYVMDAPTIDAVPVVRCKDCKFRNTSWYDKRDMLEEFCRWDRDESPNDDDYCSYGERKEVER